MPIDVTLGTQEIQILDATTGDLIDTIAYQSIDTITYVNNPGTVVVSSTLGAAPTVTGDPQWSLLLWLRDGRKSVIELGNVSNQSGWTNDQTGFDQAVADIYAAFPTGGGGGGGVTSVNASGGTTGFEFTGGPVTNSGTLTMAVDDPEQVRVSIAAASIYPTWTFSTNTNTGTDPGAHTFRFNNATLGSITAIAISNLGTFESGDQSVEVWQYSWGDALILGRVDDGATNDTIILNLSTQQNFTPYLRTTAALVTTVIGGAVDAAIPDGSKWRVISVGDGSVNANVQAQIDAVVADINSFPLRYKWLGDGGAATGTEIINTLGETINVTYLGAGIYRFTAASGTPFTTGKTTVVITPITTTTNLAAVVASMTDTEIEINIFDTFGQIGADPTQYMVIIEVEP